MSFRLLEMGFRRTVTGQWMSISRVRKITHGLTSWTSMGKRPMTTNGSAPKSTMHHTWHLLTARYRFTQALSHADCIPPMSISSAGSRTRLSTLSPLHGTQKT